MPPITPALNLCNNASQQGGKVLKAMIIITHESEDWDVDVGVGVGQIDG